MGKQLDLPVRRIPIATSTASSPFMNGLTLWTRPGCSMERRMNFGDGDIREIWCCDFGQRRSISSSWLVQTARSIELARLE
ncbi:hypothetical protein PoB_004648400 [Plakobranchus ocellatus]|uniref:Uncharacterized protein n=1 Tax=Plakobranchus ocellatus TaxID=259542 RepID=A0AAV4BNU0_9GAST|nr:hypothetical protein PoB_004648400 [Plakobranchus ocellatus]